MADSTKEIVVKTTACSGFERVRLELGLRANFY
jgi:hypothetical protein